MTTARTSASLGGHNPPSVRMKDVAARAGVSLQTVSRVVNATGTVTEETAARVLAAVQELGYRPNVLARSLATKINRTVGVVVVGEMRHGLGSSVLAVEDAARERGVLTVSTHVSTGDATSMRDAVDRILGSSVGGMVVLGPTHDVLDQVGDVWGRMPTVILTTARSTERHITTVAIDHDHAMNQIVDHLADLGCRRIAHLSGDPRWSDARLRAAAFTQRVRLRGLEGTILPGESWEASTGYQVAAGLNRGDLPDAIVASNDAVALGVMSALHEHDVRVPEDVKVVGFDDLPESAYFRPTLTTVRQDFQLLGLTAIAQLDEMMRGGDGQNIRVPAPLIVRGSTESGWTR
ncbi:LacI family transcriptional regulator [Georgenia soli]|uniref:LacI family transcriptional regulator n=1 Tax=Georgenia soli TaxID=638953 RepID=A0A2A9ES72_9MICO|nr:LacI family DNA-binding transcriptional regulator [Georgenia soli]PFG41049.1 LacI family transcriptional regulator [Georgenia soli]